MELRLEKCTIRSWWLGDKKALVKHANSPSVAANLRDAFPHPYTAVDADRWLAWATEAEPETHFAIDVGGSAVGGIGFRIQPDVHRRSAEVGFWLGEEYWGRGIMTEAVIAVTAHAFTHFDLCRMFACVFESNPASARVLEKAGYVCEGRMRRFVTKAGRTLDALLYASVRNDEES
ncbi:MAG: GNAT family N-acetyltransferase [Gemmatimonadetes bacterium]|nr:GNAT family N-acetyltransferase [Gemmatimonadota bacterium]